MHTHDTDRHRGIAEFADIPDGVIHRRQQSHHKLSVIKHGTQLHLVFRDGVSHEIQSRMDLRDPLYLVSPHTQAMMLGVVLKPDLTDVHMMGLGAGRVPMLLHHFFPQIMIDCTETDPDVVDVAQAFFGVALDERLQIHLQDGRRFLENQQPTKKYDIIFIDAFDGTGSSPFTLSTKEFYALCKRNLRSDGIVISNLLRQDRLFCDKVRTTYECFSFVACVSIKEWGGSVFYGSDRPFESSDVIVERATRIQNEMRFSFPFVTHASELRNIEEVSEFRLACQSAALLSDSTPRMDRSDG